MTEYWKSNERKYCDFCKCWIAENKISVSLHEGGKKHKENVAKRISEINKKSTKDHKSNMKIEEEMSKMEKNAMAAYMKDIQNNADLTSQMINEKLTESNSTLVYKSAPVIKDSGAGSSGSAKVKSKWQQGKKEDGSFYYWNTDTKETVKEAPEEGFVSLADLNVPMKRPNNNFTNKDVKKPKKHKEKEHSSANASGGPSNIPSTFEPMGPQPRGDPYGSWTTVNVVTAEDLQLPEQNHAPQVIPTIAVPQEKKFREKQLTSLEDSETGEVAVEFKKRKFNNAAKRNVRQRLNDD